MIRTMKRVYIFYIQERQDELVSRLQKLGLLHLEESHLDGAPLHLSRSSRNLTEDRKRVENLLIKARGICDLFAEIDPTLLRHPSAPESYPARLEDLYQQFKNHLDPMEGRLKALVSERRELRDRLAAGERLAEIVRVSEELLKVLPSEGFSLLPVILAPEQKSALPEIEQVLRREIPSQCALTHQELSEERIELLIAVHPDFISAVSEYLEAKGIRPLALPPHLTDGFVKGIAQLKAEAIAIPSRLGAIEEELKGFAREDAGRILLLAGALENRLAQLEAALGFGYTDYTLLVSGWIPQDELERFQGTLTREFPEIIVREDTSDHDHDEVPVAFRERRWAKPYQLFMQAFGTPKPRSVDPVPYISIFFPIFFAVIVGDIGYGLIILTLALWGLKGFPGIHRPGLRRFAQSETGRSAFTVMLHGGAFSIALGFLFGEFFGLEFEQLGIHGYGLWPFSRVHNAIDLLLFTVALGAIQVTMGFLFGIVTALRHHNTKHLSAKIGLFLSLIAFALILGRLMNIVPQSFLMPGIVIFAFALPLLMYGGGGMVLMESLSPFIHVLSYARIMGFGVASVVLATLINSVASGLGAMGNIVLGLILGAIVAVALHTVNLVLHVFEGTIQSARLHWVEFFEKFILEQLGGKPYQPFKEKEISIKGQ